MRKTNYILLGVLISLFLYLSPLKSIILKNSIKKIYAENIEEIPAIVGITPEFIGTYKVFLNAKGTSDYIKVSEGFKKIGERETETNDLRLHSLFLSTLSSFLAGNIEEAYQTGKQAIVVAKKIYPDERKLVVLDKVIKEIEEGEIKNAKEIRIRFKQEGIEITEDDDVFRLTEGQIELKQMEEKGISKIKEKGIPLLYKKLEQINQTIITLKEKCQKSPVISERVLPYILEMEEEYSDLKNIVDTMPFTSVAESMNKLCFLHNKIDLLQEKLDNWIGKIEEIK